MLTLGRISQGRDDPRDEIVLVRVEGDPTAAAPFGLDAATETIESARAKLSQDMARGDAARAASGDRRVSFFLDGGRVIELLFNETLAGFDRCMIARLGGVSEWGS